MKTLVFVSVIFCALVLGGVSGKTTAATDLTKRSSVTEFTKPVMVLGVVLHGKYLFVHDDAAMNRGEACSYIYEGEVADRDKLVVSFRCIHVERAKATSFVVRSRENATGPAELLEFQFSGETAAHGVPISGNTAVVPVVN